MIAIHIIFFASNIIFTVYWHEEWIIYIGWSRIKGDFEKVTKMPSIYSYTVTILNCIKEPSINCYLHLMKLGNKNYSSKMTSNKFKPPFVGVVIKTMLLWYSVSLTHSRFLRSFTVLDLKFWHITCNSTNINVWST